MEHETPGGEVADVMHAATSAGDHAAGMPQIDPSSYPNQIIWLLIALVAIYFILSRVALPRIGAVLAERQGTITNDVAAAEELKLKAAEAEKAYDKALADARAESGRIAAETRAEIQGELDEAIARADAEIAEKSAGSEARINEIRAGAMQSVDEIARDTAEAIVAALGGNPDRAAIDAAVETRIKERAR